MKLEELKQVCDSAIPILPQGIPLNYLEACVKYTPELVRRMMRLRELYEHSIDPTANQEFYDLIHSELS